jgi:hypothetical protein
MQDSSHLTIILCSSIIKIVISQKQKFNRKNNKVPVPNKARSKIRPTNDIDLLIEISKYTTT